MCFIFFGSPERQVEEDKLDGSYWAPASNQEMWAQNRGSDCVPKFKNLANMELSHGTKNEPTAWLLTLSR